MNNRIFYTEARAPNKERLETSKTWVLQIHFYMDILLILFFKQSGFKICQFSFCSESFKYHDAIPVSCLILRVRKVEKQLFKY